MKMGDEIKLDHALLLSRLEALHNHFSAHSELYGGATALQLAHGKRVENDDPLKDPLVASIQTYLFGYEFPDTLAVLANGTFYVHATAKKLSYLEAARSAASSGPVNIELIVREKGDQTVAANAAAFDRLAAAIRDSAKNGTPAKVTQFPGDPAEGTLVPAWLGFLKEKGIDQVDGIRGVEAYFAVKDAKAKEDIRNAGVLAARAMKYIMVADMESAINKETKLTNAAVSEQAQDLLSAADADALRKRKVPVEDVNAMEVALRPCVQSGGNYNVFIMGSASSGAPPKPNSDKLSYDVVMMSLGMRYGTQRAIVGRTYMIDSTPHMQLHYDALLDAQTTLIANLKPGNTIAEAVQAARDNISKAEGLNPAARLSANFGNGIGARLSDKYLVLTAKNNTMIEAGMAFCVTMGLRDVPMDDKHPIASASINNLQNYSLLIADTVLVEAGGPVVLTDKAPRDKKNVSYEMAQDEAEEEDEDEDMEEEAPKEKSARPARAVVTDESKGRDKSGRSARLKEKAQEVDPDALRKREEHQAILMVKKKEAARRKKDGGGEEEEQGDDNDIEKAPDIEAFNSPSEYPKNVRPTQVTVDKSHDAVLLPILGQLVPFHISTIKNVVKSEEGNKAFLRFNFYAPGGVAGKEVPPAMQKAVAKNPNLAYIKSLNFMSREHRNFVQVEQLVKAMLKKSREQRKEEKETSGLVAQEKLQLTRDEKLPRMTDVNMWPAASGRKSQGVLSAHANGLRFQSNKGQDPPVDIIYSNIKVPIFQPCEGEHIVLLHFHLKHPILIGKKKYKDVQFYTDVIEASEALDRRAGYGDDPDEYGEEQKQQQLKARMNAAFRKFAQKVEEIAAKDKGGMKQFDVPDRANAFHGAPFKEMTTVLPCLSAIIAVVDKPPMVVPIEDVELVHFERVVAGTKTFDLVAVFKAGVVEKGTDEFVRITGIEMKHLEPLKTWLDEIAEIPFTESGESLNWKALIGEQVRRPDFWLTTDEEESTKKYPGMLGVLHPLGEEGAEEDEDEESEEYSEDEEDEEEDDDDEDFSDMVDEDEDDDEDEDEDEDEEGEDWDELERQAEEDDRRKRKYEDDDDDDRKRKAKKARR